MAECPRPSRGVFNRVYNILWARRHQGDVNHVTGDVHYLTFSLRRSRTLLTIHDCAPLERFHGLNRYLLSLFWFRLPVARSGRIGAISNFTKRELVRHLGCRPERIEVVHDPCSSGFVASPKPFNAKHPVILQIGTGWNKNVERVARALQHLPCRLEVVGMLTDNERRALAANDVVYGNHARVSDRTLVGLYRACDLVVFTSLYEGFGLPIVEAQATGRPVVTSDRGPMPEVAGGAACLVDPESVESIRAGALKIIQDEYYREELVRKGFENVKRFGPDRIAERYARLYHELASVAQASERH